MAEQKDSGNKPMATGQRRPGVQRRSEDLSNYVFGKVQPQALPLEEAVLGAVMLDKNALTIILDILQPESFYSEGHQHIYRAMRRLFDRSQPIDLLTVMEELKKSGDLEAAGGPAYLAELTHRVASAANIEYHARIIAQKYIQRELIRVSTKTIRDAFEDTSDVFELLDEAEQGLYNIAQNNMSRGYESTGTLAGKMLKQIEELKGKKDGLTGVPTGFTALDRLTSGWQPSDLIIVAARPAMGKTGFVLSMARNAALDFKKPVAIFSLEMANLQLVLRLVSMEAEISGSKLRNGQLDEDEWKRLHKAVERISEAPIFIDDTAGINIFELRAKARRMKLQHDIQLIIIDYLQLMSGGPDSQRGNREQEISSISRSLKALAKELNVPVIALSQLSRAVEVRGGTKRPQLSDLRECVTGDTLVFLADGGGVPIKELTGQQPEVLSFDTVSQKIVPATSEIIWPVGKKPVFQVNLASGRSLKATEEHRLLTLNGWKQIKDLKSGDRPAIARTFPEPGVPMKMPDNQIILLAHLIGDGSYIKGQPLRYTTASDANSHIVANAAHAEFGVQVNRHEGKGSWHQLVFSGNGNRWHPGGINKWLRDLEIFNQRSYEKCIPASVFQLSNRQIALFLRHIWATDGTIFTPKRGRTSPKIAFSTNSRLLAENVATLLLRFQIVARIRQVQQGLYRPMFSVEIADVDSQNRFLHEIGAFGEKLEKATELSAFLKNRASNTNVDTIPAEIFEDVKTSMRNRKVSHRQMAAFRGTSYGGGAHFNFAPSREVLAEYADILKDEYLQKIAESDLFWDVVTSINPVGEEDVFDLTVSDTNSFIANGIISHNSGAIEQDADIVSFIYRPEYYQILEDEQGQSVKGMAEIIVAKHRNGAVDTVKLRFTDKFARFSDLDEFNFDALPAGVFQDPVPANVIIRPSRMNDDEDIPF